LNCARLLQTSCLVATVALGVAALSYVVGEAPSFLPDRIWVRRATVPLPRASEGPESPLRSQEFRVSPDGPRIDFGRAATAFVTPYESRFPDLVITRITLRNSLETLQSHLVGRRWYSAETVGVYRWDQQFAPNLDESNEWVLYCLAH